MEISKLEMLMNKKDLVGETFFLSGKVIEHLTLGKKEWLTLQLPDGKKITVNINICQPKAT